MAEDTRTRKILTPTFWRYGACDAGTIHMYESVYDKFHQVISERRVKPKGVIRQSNPFRVEKFNLLFPTTNSTCWTTPSGVDTVSWTRQYMRAYWFPWEEAPCQPGPLETIYENVRDNAIRDVFRKANKPARFDGAPVLFELKRTLIYIHRVLKSIRRIFVQKKGEKDWLVDALRRGKDPERLWLEYRYAIMPIILTVTDMISALKKQDVITAYDARIELTNVRNLYEWLDLKYNHYGTYGVHIETLDTITATAKIKVRTQFDPAPLGLGLMDMVRGAWEVVPLSFVIDWFVGIEDWLTSIRNTNLEIADSYVTTVVDRRGKMYYTNTPPLELSNLSLGDFHHFVMKREVDIQPPHYPLWQAELLSAYRTTDAISLIVKFLKMFLSSKR